MINQKNIGKILKSIDRNSKAWSLPSVSMIAQARPSPFRVLISTVLSLRTKDEVTWRASQRLFEKADTPQRMLKLSNKEIEQLIYPVAFYRNKTQHILEICRDLLNKYDGVVPRDLDELLKFKGVGRKTANLVLILGYGIPAMCVDTHVHRISNRFGYIRTKTPNESELHLRKKLPVRYWLKYNDLLVSFGQNLCKPISPHCSKCPISTHCPKIGVIKRR